MRWFVDNLGEIDEWSEKLIRVERLSKEVMRMDEIGYIERKIMIEEKKEDVMKIDDV